MLKPYFWKQTDKRWAKHSWKGVTVGGSGCGPTAIACVVSALVKEVTPKKVFDWICKKGYMHPSQGTYWNGITKALKHYGITKFSVSYNTKAAKKELAKGKWMIGVVGPSRWTRGGHYIVVYGFHGSSKIYVSDPASSSNYRQKDGTWSEFAKAENCMWISIDPKDYGKSSSKPKATITVIMYVSEANVNIRKGRSTKYGVAGTIKRGTKLELKNYKDGWYEIAKGTYKGKFIAGSSLVKYPPHVATYKTKYVMNIRAGYTTKAKVLGQVAKGAKIKSAYKVGNWIYVPALKGWICLKDNASTYCVEVKASTSKKKSNKKIAKEVIAGKWGNGDVRKKKLKAAGYDYNAIQKEVTKLLKYEDNMGKVYMEGIDISSWNGNIDLKPYKKQFVIIRIGYDTTLDSKAKRNMDECERLGIPYGVYLYSYALNVAQAKKEAEFVLKSIKGRKIQVGVWFDMEDADGYKKKKGMPSNDTITNMCNEFCKIIKNAGYYAGVYASESWFGSKIKSSMKYPKWVANWGSNNGKRQSDKSSIGPLHQYTSKPLDKNVMYVPLSTFVGGKKSKTKPSAKKKSKEEIAKEVINGKWGNGSDRKKRLEAAGYNYVTIQKKVNELLKSKKVKSTYEVAREVIAGKWGNGNERKRKLENAGYNYYTVQEMVNKLLK